MSLKTTFKITFWLNHCKKNKQNLTPIYLRVTDSEKHFTMTTSLYIRASLWDKKKGRVKGNDEQTNTINESLSAIKSNVQRINNQLILSNKPFTLHSLKDILNGRNKSKMKLIQIFDSHLDEIKQLLDRDYSKKTLLKFQSTRSRVAEFIRQKYNLNDIDVSEIDNNIMDEFILYLKTKYLNNQNTCYKHCQRFKKILNIAVKKGYCDTYPLTDYILKRPKSEIEYLTQEEVDRIINTDVHIPRLQIIKDLFIFSCFTGLAFAEINNLSKSDIFINSDKKQWIQVHRQKTGKNYTVPLLPPAQKIFNHYTGLSTGEKIFPVPSNSKYNAYLKEIATLANIRKNCTTHLARKTYSLFCLNNNISIGVLSRLLGHSSVKITIESYYKIVDNKVIQEVGNLRNQLYKSQ